MDAETLREAVELSNHVIQQIDGHLKDIEVIDGIIQSLDAVSQPQDVPVFFLNTKPRGFLNPFPHKQNYIHKYLHIHEIYIDYICMYACMLEKTHPIVISTSLAQDGDSQLCASLPCTPTELEASHTAAVISLDDEMKACQCAAGSK